MTQTLYKTKHKTHMINILSKIYKNPKLSGLLGFKGGTAAMLFYKLPRFSVDLDFDFICEQSGQINSVISEIDQILSKEYEIKDGCKKINTLFWSVSYADFQHNIKIEISTRSNINKYSVNPMFGIPIRVMEYVDMVPNKMIALIERKTFASRDLFDIHFFLSQPSIVDMNFDIIQNQYGDNMNLKIWFEKLLDFVKKVNKNKILDGLGELISDDMKKWAKAHLVDETVELLDLRLNLLK
jgi:predicted nucleotidyltransferase component of viral defense system